MKADAPTLPRFNVLEEPSVPVSSGAGERRVSVRDALLNAHDIDGVSHAIPIVEFGLVRLLVTIAMDAVEPQTRSDLLDLLAKGRFDAGLLNRYLKTNEAVFDLFSSDSPFLQNRTNQESRSPVASLLPSIPSGTNVVHWHHRIDAEFAVSPPEALGLLCAISPFMTEGGAGLSPSINGAPPWYVVPLGRNLFETLVLNMWVSHQKAVGRGVPAWRNRSLPEAKKRRTSSTLLESFTWRPRALRLAASGAGTCSVSGEESDVLVREMNFSAGEAAGFDWDDPNVAYRKTKKGRFPVRPREDRDPWRDVAVFALLSDDGAARAADSVLQTRPALVSQLSALMQDSKLLWDLPLRLRLYGMRTNHMKVFEWHRQDLRLPTTALWDAPLQGLLVSAVGDAERAQGELARALGAAASRGGHKVSSQARALVHSESARYWQVMEPLFSRLAVQAGPLQPESDGAALDRLALQWRSGVYTLALDAFSSGVDSMRRDPARILSIERARQSLRKGLRFLRPSWGAEPGESGTGRGE